MSQILPINPRNRGRSTLNPNRVLKEAFLWMMKFNELLTTDVQLPLALSLSSRGMKENHEMVRIPSKVGIFFNFLSLGCS